MDILYRRQIFFFFLVVFGATNYSSAQVISQNGRFSINFDRICRGDTIIITNLFTGTTTGIGYDFGLNGNMLNPIEPDDPFVYDTAGRFRIFQAINTVDDLLEDFVFVEVVDENTRPDISIFSCSQNRIAIGLNSTDTVFEEISYSIPELGLIDKTVSRGQDTVISFPNEGDHIISDIRGVFGSGSNEACNSFDTTIVTSTMIQAAEMISSDVEEINSVTGMVRLSARLFPGTSYTLEISRPNSISGFQPLSFFTGSGVTDFLIDSLNTENQYFCFRISASNICSGNAELFSETICSVTINVNSQPNRNLVSWNTEPINFQSSSLERNNLSIFNNDNQSIESFTDDDILCNVENCYQVIYTYSNGLISRSGIVCITAETTIRPDGIENITPTVIDGNVFLDWDENPVRGSEPFEISRGFTPDAISFLDITQDSEFTDVTAEVNSRNHFYEASFDDECDNESLESITASPILLTLGERLGNNITLNWSELLGWSNGVSEYFFETLDENGNILNSANQGLNTSFPVLLNPASENQNFLFRVTAVPSDPTLPEAQSNLLNLVLEPELRLPNAFGPPGGQNSVFSVQGIFISSFALRIYNRWGEIIHFSENSGWNGRTEITGEFAPSGTYAWQIDFTDFNGVNYSESGFVVFIR